MTGTQPHETWTYTAAEMAAVIAFLKLPGRHGRTAPLYMPVPHVDGANLKLEVQWQLDGSAVCLPQDRLGMLRGFSRVDPRVFAKKYNLWALGRTPDNEKIKIEARILVHSTGQLSAQINLKVGDPKRPAKGWLAATFLDLDNDLYALLREPLSDDAPSILPYDSGRSSALVDLLMARSPIVNGFVHEVGFIAEDPDPPASDSGKRQ